MKISEFFYTYKPTGFAKKMGGCNTYVLKGSKKQVIIDMGRGLSLKRLKKEMKEDGLDISQTSEIWLTHIHPDHTRISGLVKFLKCKVRCHPDGISILNAFSPWDALLKKQRDIAEKWEEEIYPYSLPTFLIKFGVMVYYGKWRRIDKDIIIPFEDKEIIDFGDFKIKVFYFPGHTDDSLAFWLRKRRILVSGDLIRTSRKHGVPCWNTYQANFQSTIKSLSFLRFTRINILAPGHGSLYIGFWKIHKIILWNMATAQKLRMRVQKFLIDNNKNFRLSSLIYSLRDIWGKDLSKSDKVQAVFTVIRDITKKIPTHNI